MGCGVSPQACGVIARHTHVLHREAQMLITLHIMYIWISLYASMLDSY